MEDLSHLFEPIGSIRPCPRNPRKGHAVDAIARSIREFGWHAPIVARMDGEVIVGHGRLEAAQLLGLEEVPVLRVDDTKEKAIARMVADNRLTDLSEWDNDELLALIDDTPELEAWSDDLDLDALMSEMVNHVIPDVGEIDDDGGDVAVNVPSKDGNVVVRVSFPSAVWLSKRDEVMGVLENIKSSYLAVVRVDE